MITNPNSPLVTILPPYVAGYTMGGSQIYVFPLTLTSNMNLMFFLRHTDLMREDWSVQTWWSRSPGTAVIYGPDGRCNQSIFKHKTRAFAIQDKAYTGHTVVPTIPNVITMPLAIGTYYFNVENRSNTTNKFDIIYQATELT